MNKKMYVWLVAALLSVPASAMAQEIIEIVDSVWVDITPCDSICEGEMIIDSVYTDTGEIVADTIRLGAIDEWQQNLPQYDLKEYEWVEICYNPKYAIVTKDGKNGIYDMEQHRNITEIIYRDLGFSKQTLAEDSSYISLFYGTMGIKRGIISVYEPSNNVVSIWMDDPDEVYSLDECTTIDKKITKRAKNLLEGFVQKEHLDNAEIVILDAETGRLKT